MKQGCKARYISGIGAELRMLFVRQKQNHSVHGALINVILENGVIVDRFYGYKYVYCATEVHGFGMEKDYNI